MLLQESNKRQKELNSQLIEHSGCGEKQKEKERKTEMYICSNIGECHVEKKRILCRV